jgi:hypothetical protein
MITSLLVISLQFFDSTFVCQGEGREVTRVQQSGTVRLKLNVVTKGMQSAGYSSCDSAIKTT